MVESVFERSFSEAEEEKNSGCLKAAVKKRRKTVRPVRNVFAY